MTTFGTEGNDTAKGSPASTPGVRRWNVAFWLVCLLFAAAATFVNFTAVLHWAPDEPEHLKYVAAIASGHFPNAVESKEAFQAPLYYIVCAPVYRIFLGAGVDLAEHAVRELSVLWGVLTLLLIRRMVRRLLPGREELGVAAAAIVAFHPFFTYLMGVCNNDTLFILLSTASLYLLMESLTERSGYRAAALLGALLGLALLAKYLTLALFLLPVALALIRWRLGDSPAEAGRRLGITLGVAFATALPWLLRNQFVHGNLLYDIIRPSDTEIAWFQDRVAHGLVPPDSLVDGVQSLVRGIFLTFWCPSWVIKPYLDVTGPLYTLLAALLALCPMVGVLLYVRKFTGRAADAADPRYALALLALAPVLLGAAVVRYALVWDYSIIAHGGRYLLGIIAVLGCFYAAAIEGFARRPVHRWILCLVVGLVFLVLDYLSLRAIYDFYKSGIYMF